MSLPHFRIAIIFILTIVILPSCNTHQKLVYFQEEISASAEINSNYTPVFKTDDLLSIIVSGDLESAIPFNFSFWFSSSFK